MWLIPDVPVVKVSTVWTPAEAAAGGIPRLISERARDDPEGHSQRAVDQLRGKARGDERQQRQ